MMRFYFITMLSLLQLSKGDFGQEDEHLPGNKKGCLVHTGRGCRAERLSIRYSLTSIGTHLGTPLKSPPFLHHRNHIQLLPILSRTRENSSRRVLTRLSVCDETECSYGDGYICVSAIAVKLKRKNKSFHFRNSSEIDDCCWNLS